MSHIIALTPVKVAQISFYTLSTCLARVYWVLIFSVLSQLGALGEDLSDVELVVETLLFVLLLLTVLFHVCLVELLLAETDKDLIDRFKGGNTSKLVLWNYWFGCEAFPVLVDYPVIIRFKC